MDASYPRIAGDARAPILGRAVVRDFGGGRVEVSAGFCRRDPSEVELFNAWAGSVGSDERMVPFRGVRAVSGEAARSVSSRETDAERSARRARQKVRFACKAIGVDRLMTLTYRANVSDLAESKKHFVAWARRVREHYSAFRYVAVPELQERGAIHWHVAVSGFYDVNLLRALWLRTLGVRVRRSELRCPPRLGPEAPGNIDITAPRSRGQRRRVWAVDRLAGYISKYVGKTIGEIAGAGVRSFMVPQGIERTYRTVRYFIRGEGRRDLAVSFFELLNGAGAVRPFVWQSADGMRLWGCGSGGPASTPEAPG